jgi:multidrug transporter EmrE-like cation transporter
MGYFLIALAWLFMAVASVVLKYGDLHDSRRIVSFIVANAFGITGTWFVMLSYRTLSPNVVVAMWMGGGFLISQIAVSMYYKSYPTLPQYLAGGLIIAGIILFALTSKPSA